MSIFFNPLSSSCFSYLRLCRDEGDFATGCSTAPDIFLIGIGRVAGFVVGREGRDAGGGSRMSVASTSCQLLEKIEYL